MKKLFFLVVFILFSSLIYASDYEGKIRAFRTVGGEKQAISVPVKIYYGGQLLVVNGYTFNGNTAGSFTDNEYNGSFGVTDVSGVNPGTFVYEIPYDIAITQVKIVIGTVFINWTWTNMGDTNFIYDEDAGTITSVKVATNDTTIVSSEYSQYTIKVKNSFSGGLIQINNNEPENVPTDGDGYLTKTFSNLDNTVSVTALPNQEATYYYNWDKWSLDETPDLTKTLPQSATTLQANFQPIERITIAGTSAYINSTESVQENEYVKKKLNEQISISMNQKTINSLLYGVDYVNKNDVYHTSSSTFNYTPVSMASTTFTAVMEVIKPVNNYRNMYFTGSTGDYVAIHWSEHPSNDVTTYRIYRKSYGESVGTLVDSVSRGTTSYTDYQYIYTDDLSINNRKYYDVRAVYLHQIETDPDYMLEYAIPEQSVRDNNPKSMQAEIMISSSVRIPTPLTLQLL